MTWQPIETAPRDGTLVLVYREGIIDMAVWSDHFACWITCASNQGEKRTHWMPLPEPPEEE